MKNTLRVILCLIFFNLSAQESEKAAVQKTIEDFFKGFHKQDSIQIKETVAEGVIMQTIINAPDGTHSVKTEEFSDFLRNISKIPDTMKFEEKILDYYIQVDGPMANAWTAYEFWINGERNHCGVNSFQLFKNRTGWKIIYLIDTRRTDDCE